MTVQTINDTLLAEHPVRENSILGTRYATEPGALSSIVAMGLANSKPGAVPIESMMSFRKDGHLPEARFVESSPEMLERLEKYHATRTKTRGATSSATVFSGSTTVYDASRQAAIALVESNSLDWKSARDQQVLRHNLTEVETRLKALKERASATSEKKSTLIRSTWQIIGAAASILAAGVIAKYQLPSRTNTANTATPGASGAGTKAPDGMTGTASKAPDLDTAPGIPKPVKKGVTENTVTQPRNDVAPTVAAKTEGVPAPTLKAQAEGIPGPTRKADANVASRSGDTPENTGQPKGPDGHGNAASANANTGEQNAAGLIRDQMKFALMTSGLGALGQLFNQAGELHSMNEREKSKIEGAEATEFGALAEKSRSDGEIFRSNAQFRDQGGVNSAIEEIKKLNEVENQKKKAIVNG